MVVAVAAALGGLKIVGLRGLDVAETGTSAHHVDDEGGELGRGYVAYAFLFERLTPGEDDVMSITALPHELRRRSC